MAHTGFKLSSDALREIDRFFKADHAVLIPTEVASEFNRLAGANARFAALDLPRWIEILPSLPALRARVLQLVKERTASTGPRPPRRAPPPAPVAGFGRELPLLSAELSLPAAEFCQLKAELARLGAESQGGDK
jgi:hypothetical protein